MHLLPRARFLLPAAVVTVVLATSCGGKGSSGPSQATVQRVTAADVVSVLKSHNETPKGVITCAGIAPGIIDCHGTTTNGDDVQATLEATTAGQTCQGPLVVNVKGVKLDALPDEKCA
jgi:hypothetical protein